MGGTNVHFSQDCQKSDYTDFSVSFSSRAPTCTFAVRLSETIGINGFGQRFGQVRVVRNVVRNTSAFGFRGVKDVFDFRTIGHDLFTFHFGCSR